MDSERVIACLSGGVDSSVAAARLVDAGYDVVGVFMRSGVSGQTTGERQGCCSVEDALDARRVADLLGIPFYALNMEDEFGRVIDRFVSDYAAGRTPNPCVLCNRWLKFGHVLEFARKVGAAKVASGHYAQIVPHRGRLALARPVDRVKDQSYVLSVLTQDQLAHVLFPLGASTKDDVRREATQRGLLRVADKRDSQEICFVAGDYRDLLRERLPADAEALQPGEVRDQTGAVLGRHTGTANYTIGQRRGLGIAAAHPLYVTDLDTGRRLVTVGPRAALGCVRLTADELTWLGVELEVGASTPGRAQIQAHGRTTPGTLTRTGPDAFDFDFDTPVPAVMPGQAVVVYDPEDHMVYASGWIRRARREGERDA